MRDLTSRRLLPLAAPLCLLLALGSAPESTAQIGPDSYGYHAYNVPYQWDEIAGTGTRVLGDADDTWVDVPIGFTFPFYGTSYTTASLASNGFLSFQSGNGNRAFSNRNLASQVAPNYNSGGEDYPIVCALWEDLFTYANAPADPDAVYYETRGSAGSRLFIVQWNYVGSFDLAWNSGYASFQAILLEGSGSVVVRYNDAEFSDGGSDTSHDFGRSATIGIRDTGGHLNGRNLQWLYNGNPRQVQSGEAIEFSLTNIPEPGTGAVFLLGLAVLAVRRRARR